MGQVRDTLVWLAMILVVGGVIYIMPQVSAYVDAATGSEHGAACETCREAEAYYHDVNRHSH
jgi:hypothetical protein